jgi:hypothetical protein
MSEQHPLHTLRGQLEALRVQTLDRLAASEAPLTTDALQELAAIQAALTAVREEMQSRGVGWGGNASE